MHSIFQISIFRNTICAEMVDFRKPGHILYFYSKLLCKQCAVVVARLPRDSNGPDSILTEIFFSYVNFFCNGLELL